MEFKDFGLSAPIMQALIEEGYETPTLIQKQAIPIIMNNQDLLGCAQTGTGKTAAFALPLIQKILTNNKEKHIKILVLSPTRELAIQIRDSFRTFAKYTDLKCSVILGGVNQKSQIEVLKKGIDILVATPGRLLDLIKQKHVKLDQLQYLVLDEADTMLDMGFIHDVKKIIAMAPIKRQTLLFSATMPQSIEELSTTFLNKPQIVKVTPVSSTVSKIKQTLYQIDKTNKPKLLITLLNKETVQSALIFTRTKHGANKLNDILISENIKSNVIHGNKSQSARVIALKQFKEKKIKVLIATDIAARGIDVRELSHVFNYDMPDQAETYVHRIGRTGRAGFEGQAISLANVDELAMVKEIEKLIKQTLTIITDHNYPMKVFTLTPKKIQVKKYKKNNSYETKTYNKNLKTNKIKNNYQGNKQRTFNSSNQGK